MASCEWVDETDEVTGSDQYCCDGEDFIVFDLQTEKWIALTPKAAVIKDILNFVNSAGIKKYLTQDCPAWVKRFVNYGRSSLLRTGEIISYINHNLKMSPQFLTNSYNHYSNYEAAYRD